MFASFVISVYEVYKNGYEFMSGLVGRAHKLTALCG